MIVASARSISCRAFVARCTCCSVRWTCSSAFINDHHYSSVGTSSSWTSASAMGSFSSSKISSE